MSTANQEEFINRIKMALGKPIATSQRDEDLFKSEMSDETRAILERIKIVRLKKEKSCSQLLSKPPDPST